MEILVFLVNLVSLDKTVMSIQSVLRIYAGTKQFAMKIAIIVLEVVKAKVNVPMVNFA